MYSNTGKQRLLRGEKLSASWVQMASPIACEIMAQAGFDILVIDAEHAPIDPINMVSLLHACQGYPAMPMARAPWNDLVAIKRLLDCGVQGLHIPYVSTPEEALHAVRACKYPPQGNRGIAGSPRACGYGQNRGQYLQRANDELLIMLAIETPEGVANVEKLMAVEGVDGIFIGPMDLSTTMGYFGQPNHPEVQKLIRTAEEKILAAGKLMGTTAGNAAAAQALYERGYSYVIFDSDSGTLAAIARKEVEVFQQYQSRM